MEINLKNIADITYMSKLILDTKTTTFSIESYVSRINSPK